MISKNNETEIRIVATLGEQEELTCSQYVANKKNIGKIIIPCNSFEMAIGYVKEGKADVALVPGAYPEIRRIIMDPDLIAVKSFIFKIPSLVLAGKIKSIPKHIDILFYHPATVRLLDELSVKYSSSIPVSSNAESCRRVLEKPNTSLAITNELCSEYFNLKIYKVIRKALKMPWICFQKNNSAN